MLSNRPSARDTGRCFQRGMEGSLIGLELLPSISGAADRRGGEKGKDADHPVSHPRLSPPLALGAAEHFVGGHIENARDDFGESERLAVALLPRIGGEQLKR